VTLNLLLRVTLGLGFLALLPIDFALFHTPSANVVCGGAIRLFLLHILHGELVGCFQEVAIFQLLLASISLFIHFVLRVLGSTSLIHQSTCLTF